MFALHGESSAMMKPFIHLGRIYEFMDVRNLRCCHKSLAFHFPLLDSFGHLTSHNLETPPSCPLQLLDHFSAL